MDEHWTTKLGNTSSDALRHCWRDLAGAFGRQICNHSDPEESSTWQVLQLPTGSGKSQGTAVYCSMLAAYPREMHPGILIVTRMKVEADQMAAAINQLSGRDGYAVSFHGDKDIDGMRQTLLQYPVVVITHKAYELALQRLQEDAPRQSWGDFYEWNKTGRMLVVIDEALPLVSESKVDLDGLRRTFGAIPQTIRDLHPAAIQAISALVSLLEDKAEKKDGQEAIIPRCALAQDAKVDLIGLRKAMYEVRFDEQQNRSDLTENRTLFRQHDDRLQAVQDLLDSDMFHAKVPRFGHTLNSSKLLIPQRSKGAVVLDATASANVKYELFAKAKVWPVPQSVRSYANVKLNVNRQLNVGKIFLTKEAEQILPFVVDDLNRRLSNRNVFFVTHDALESEVVALKTEFTNHVGHWGAVDGSNEWMNCDSAVLFGLRTMPTTWTANTYFALQGMKDTEWLRASKRPFGKHEDIRHSLKIGQTISEIVQAINRIRCRRVIDENGNCPDAEIYLFLPIGPSGDEILEGVRKMMDGIRVAPWVIQGLATTNTVRGRPKVSGNMQLALLTHLRSMKPGRLSKSALKLETGVKDSTLKRFIADAKDSTTDIAKTLESLGITFVCEGLGKNAKSFFVR